MKPGDLDPAITPDLNLVPVILSSARSRRSSARPRWVWVVMLILAALYVLSPIDFIPDVLPVLGWIDDVAVILITILTAVPKIVRR